MPDDAELMARVQAGEQSALEILFARWEAPVFQYFYRLGCPPSAIGDLTEEVLVLVYRRRHHYDPARPFPPWLFGIARLVWKDYLRHRGREIGRSVPVEEVELVDPDPGPLGAVEADEAVERFRHAVERLPDEQRMTFLLRHYHGLSYEEVAEALGVPLGTVKWRLHEAVQRLREALALGRREGGTR
jgi:RNA polymerase sigma-70 factor (ECF subfamily)